MGSISGWTGADRAAARRWPTPPAGCSARASAARPTSGPIPRGRSATSSLRRGRRSMRAEPAARARRPGRGARARRGQRARARRSGWRPGCRSRAPRSRSDAVVALKGALGDDDGITAAIGTGSVFGVQRGGAVRMIGGWGFQLGDHGSGAAMGAGALRRGAARARRGGRARRRCWRGSSPSTAGRPGSSPGARRRAGGLRPAGAAGPRGGGGRRPGGGGDPRRAEAEVARAIDRLMADGPAPVAFLGGLGRPLRGRLGGRYGGLVRAPKGSGLDGALLLARRLG